MTIKLIEGDLFITKAEIIAHGCNTKGAFGSGVAGKIAKLWPRVREAYREKFVKDGWRLGEVQLVIANEDGGYPIVANVATQNNYKFSSGKDDVVYADYSAIYTGLEKVIQYADKHNYRVSMPRIGAGLANGDWNVIFSIIQKLAIAYPNVDIEIYSLPGNGATNDII